MFKILRKQALNSSTKLMEISAPLIAKKAKPGQFIMLRINEEGERIPLTIADYNVEQGFVTIIFQELGCTTKLLGALNEGDSILDFVGPLGVPTHLEGYEKVAIIGGGLGTAIAYPQAKYLYQKGVWVDLIAGFRNKDMIILEEELKKVANRLFVTTDDGSNGSKGFVTDVFNKLLDEKNKYDCVIAIGPLIMMKAVSELTRKYNIKTIVSMNPIMIDGTGMCGGCRVTIGGKTKFACVDGPDFDGHEVDFDQAMRRQMMYKEFEKSAEKYHHTCKLEDIKNA